MKTTFFIILLYGFNSTVFADLKIGDFNLPEKITIDKTNLVLNGTAYRTVSMFNVKVWLSSLYLEAAEKKAEAILASKTMKIIDLYPMYEISASDSVKGWKLAFDDNCEEKCESLKPEIKRFMNSVPQFKKGDRYRYLFSATEVKFLLNDKELFHSTSAEFTTLLLSTWIGKKPPTAEVKQGLLKGYAKP